MWRAGAAESGGLVAIDDASACPIQNGEAAVALVWANTAPSD